MKGILISGQTLGREVSDHRIVCGKSQKEGGGGELGSGVVALRPRPSPGSPAAGGRLFSTFPLEVGAARDLCHCQPVTGHFLQHQGPFSQSWTGLDWG